MDRPLPRIVRPLQEFLRTEAAGGVLLLVAAIAALIWANAPFGDSYGEFWGAYLTIDVNVLELRLTIGHWVNDGLMAVFFFVVGLEIKREVLHGELADRRKAALPVAAAIGGMVVPALIYTAFNAGGSGADGWGIPMATDIAFAVGVLSLVGPRVPLALKVFLLALAIADDLGAIVVIAIFYTESIEPVWLAAGGAFLALTAFGVWLGVRQMFVYAILGVATWLAVYESGIHATIAGVALGLLMPASPRVSRDELTPRGHDLLDDVRRSADAGTRDSEVQTRDALSELEESARDGRAILDRLEHALHPWTSFVIIPLFALANAGVQISGDTLRDAASSPVSIGVALGLVLGKPLGITLFALVAVKLGVAVLPDEVEWPEIISVGLIAGIGFTVSIFISNLAFSDAAMVDQAKIGVLVGSALVGAVGFGVLYRYASVHDPASEERAPPAG